MTKVLKNPTAQEKRDLLTALLACGYAPVPGVQGPGIQTPQPESITVEDMLSGDPRRTSGWTYWGPDPFEPLYVLPGEWCEFVATPEFFKLLANPGLVGQVRAAIARAEAQARAGNP